MGFRERAGRTKTLQLKTGKCEMMTETTTYIKVPFKRAIKLLKTHFHLQNYLFQLPIEIEEKGSLRTLKGLSLHLPNRARGHPRGCDGSFPPRLHLTY